MMMPARCVRRDAATPRPCAAALNPLPPLARRCCPQHIYHCPYCNVCRLGRGLGKDFFHCMRCNACVSRSLPSHQCVERTLERDCPICSENLFNSTRPLKVLRCGHTLHMDCFVVRPCARAAAAPPRASPWPLAPVQSYNEHNYTCPLCLKCTRDMSQYFRDLDAWVAAHPMPVEFVDRYSRLLCNDCECKGVSLYHFLYNKCTQCGSYNTRVLEGPLPRDALVAAEEPQHAAHGVHVRPSDGEAPSAVSRSTSAPSGSSPVLAAFPPPPAATHAPLARSVMVGVPAPRGSASVAAAAAATPAAAASAAADRPLNQLLPPPPDAPRGVRRPRSPVPAGAEPAAGEGQHKRARTAGPRRRARLHVGLGQGSSHEEVAGADAVDPTAVESEF